MGAFLKLEDGLLIREKYIIDILKTELDKKVLKLFHTKLEVGNAEIGNIMPF